MLVGRRFDAQATALTKQGRLAVYLIHGQEACEVGAVVACASRTGCSRRIATALAIHRPLRVDDAWSMPRCLEAAHLPRRRLRPRERLQRDGVITGYTDVVDPAVRLRHFRLRPHQISQHS